MTKDEFEQITVHTPNAEKNVRLVPDMWTANRKDRTLLYGYDIERRTWHLYLYKSCVWLHIYAPINRSDSVRDSIRVNLTDTGFSRSDAGTTLVPNKRLYPERCDAEFAMWLIAEYGIELPFTKFDDREMSLNDSGYYGDM